MGNSIDNSAILDAIEYYVIAVCRFISDWLTCFIYFFVGASSCSVFGWLLFGMTKMTLSEIYDIGNGSNWIYIQIWSLINGRCQCRRYTQSMVRVVHSLIYSMSITHTFASTPVRNMHANVIQMRCWTRDGEAWNVSTVWKHVIDMVFHLPCRLSKHMIRLFVTNDRCVRTIIKQ